MRAQCPSISLPKPNRDYFVADHAETKKGQHLQKALLVIWSVVQVIIGALALAALAGVSFTGNVAIALLILPCIGIALDLAQGRLSKRVALFALTTLLAVATIALISLSLRTPIPPALNWGFTLGTSLGLLLLRWLWVALRAEERLTIKKALKQLQEKGEAAFTIDRHPVLFKREKVYGSVHIISPIPRIQEYVFKVLQKQGVEHVIATKR